MNDNIMDEIRLFHIQLDQKIGDDQYIFTDNEFSAYVNEDVPEPGIGTLYPDEFVEEPYSGYNLPDVDEVGKMEDEQQAADVFDRYLGAEVLMPGNSGQDQMVRVVKRIKGNDGQHAGSYNPILDTSEYLVEFPDGSTKEITANIIAESMFSQVDSEGRHFQILREITDHRKDSSAIPKEDGHYKSNNGNMVPKFTTCGWQLLVE